MVRDFAGSSSLINNFRSIAMDYVLHFDELVYYIMVLVFVCKITCCNTST